MIRIIPAHAGFTMMRVFSSSRWADHPRTRGVYSRSICIWLSWTGSSPHTRGLRPEPLTVIPQMGIIPAHAGFT